MKLIVASIVLLLAGANGGAMPMLAPSDGGLPTPRPKPEPMPHPKPPTPPNPNPHPTPPPMPQIPSFPG